MADENVTLMRLEDQIEWYDSHSKSSKRWFGSLKIITIGLGSIVPLSAGFEFEPLITACLSVVVVVSEGIQQVFQFQHNWITYRSTAEYLKHEKYLYGASAGPYTKTEDCLKLLAERVESLVSQEHAKWVSSRESRKETDHK